MSESSSIVSTYAFENGPDLVPGHVECLQGCEVISVKDNELMLLRAHAEDDARFSIGPDCTTPTLVSWWVSEMLWQDSLKLSLDHFPLLEVPTLVEVVQCCFKSYFFCLAVV